jgi:hypothetical protein
VGQHQGRIGGEGTQEMGGLAVMEAIKAPAQHLAVDRDRTLLRWTGLLVEDGGMASEDLLNRVRVHLLDDPSDGRVSRSASPRQVEHLAQPGQVDIDERVDGPVRVRPGDNRHNGEQHDVREAVQLAFRPPRILDLGQQGEKRCERLHGNLVLLERRLPGTESEASVC